MHESACARSWDRGIAPVAGFAVIVLAEGHLVEVISSAVSA